MHMILMALMLSQARAERIVHISRTRCLASAARALQDDLFVKTGEDFVLKRTRNSAKLEAASGEAVFLKTVWIDEEDGRKIENYFWRGERAAVIISVRARTCVRM